MLATAVGRVFPDPLVQYVAMDVSASRRFIQNIGVDVYGFCV